MASQVPQGTIQPGAHITHYYEVAPLHNCARRAAAAAASAAHAASRQEEVSLSLSPSLSPRDMCGTCLPSALIVCPSRDARNPRLLFRFACCVHASELLASSGAPGELLVALGLGRIVKRAGGLVDDLL